MSRMKEHMMTCNDSKCEVCHPIDQQIIRLVKAMKLPIQAMLGVKSNDYGQGFCDACDAIVKGVESYMSYNRKET